MEPDIPNATLRALRRILRATDAGNRKLASTTGLTPSQLLVLREIDSREGTTPSAIAQQLQFSHATITAVVDRLVALGLVNRRRSDRDKRQFHLDPTSEGRRRASGAPDNLQEIFTSRFGKLPAWEQAMILAATERLVTMLGVDTFDAAPLLDTGPIDRDGDDNFSAPDPVGP